MTTRKPIQKRSEGRISSRESAAKQVQHVRRYDSGKFTVVNRGVTRRRIQAMQRPRAPVKRERQTLVKLSPRSPGGHGWHSMPVTAEKEYGPMELPWPATSIMLNGQRIMFETMGEMFDWSFWMEHMKTPDRRSPEFPDFEIQFAEDLGVYQEAYENGMEDVDAIDAVAKLVNHYNELGELIIAKGRESNPKYDAAFKSFDIRKLVLTDEQVKEIAAGRAPQVYVDAFGKKEVSQKHQKEAQLIQSEKVAQEGY